MPWFPTYKKALLAAVAAAWPEVSPGSFAAATAIEKRNWVNLLESRRMGTPWAVADIRMAPTDDWGLGATRYAVTTVLYYIAADADLLALLGEDAPTADAVLNARAGAMKAALLASDAFPGTLLADVGIDAGLDNAVNESMLSALQPFTSVSVTFTLIVVDDGP